MKNIEVKKLTKEEFEDFILMKKIEDASLEEITELLLNQSYLVMLWQQVHEQQKDEIERLNNRVRELEKGVSRKEEQITNLDDENFDLENEIERLNNIINELEKWLDKKEKLTFNSWNKGIHEVQRKLQELKGDDKE